MQVQAASLNAGGYARNTAPRAAAFLPGRFEAMTDTVSLSASGVPENYRLTFPVESLSPQRVQEIAAQPNPIVRNLQITAYYHEVACALRDMVGAEGGNNWPAWAGWASKHVGEHIRREDLPFLRGTCKVTTAIARALLPGSIHAAIWGPSDAMDRANDAVSKANKAIFERTCMQFTRFIATFRGDKTADQHKWTEFAKGFQPGSYEEGGEDLLREGFRSYYEAMFEPDAKKKAELVLLGNCQVVYDEQKHAHDEINEAIPWYAGRPVTSWSLYLDTPNEHLRLGKDLPLRPDGQMYPPALRELTNAKLLYTFSSHSRARGVSDGTLANSRCQDYRKLEDRMNMIVNVFRTRHDDQSLFEAPFDPHQTREIQAGRVPAGKL